MNKFIKMKKLITTALLIAAISPVFAQSNNYISAATKDSLFLTSESGYNFKPLWYSFNGGVNGKEMLKIKIPQNKFPFDSLVMYVKKSQLRWLNDSTLVVHKP
jgi:hypothetical protein